MLRKALQTKRQIIEQLNKRILGEQEEKSKKKELIQLLEQNGFKLNTKYKSPTYTKITDKGEFSFIFSSYSNNTKFQFYVKNPSEDIIKSFLLKLTPTKGFYADAETLSSKKGWDYASTFEKGESSTGERQLKSYMGKI